VLVVNRRFALLVGEGELDLANRWRLAASLFEQRRSLVEGSCALAIVQVTCLWRTGDTTFLAFCLLTLMVTLLRVLQGCAFRQGAPAMTPELWAGRFVLGTTATSALWSVTELVLFYRFDDPVLQLFALMIHAGWQSGAAARNAASPRAIMMQSVIMSIPGLWWATMYGHGFVRIMVPFALLQISATLSIARSCGGMLKRTMLSEQRLSEANARLTALSATDALTGIGNRRAFDQALQSAWQQAARDGTDLALLLLDVDHFKSFNDRYGHPAGDGCLRLIGAVLAAGIRRPSDFAARYGGEEFVILLPATTEAGARELGELLGTMIEEAAMPHQGSLAGLVTVSIGAASMSPSPGDDSAALLALADRALYHAKQTGRARVCTASQQAGFTAMVGACIAARPALLAPEPHA
jgi:diguanylate cyclase (GGDEF)-like protein